MTTLTEQARMRVYALGSPDEMRAVMRVRRLAVHNRKVKEVRNSMPRFLPPGWSVLWGSMGPMEYHDCKGGTVAADKPAPSLAVWASGHCPTCHQHKDVMGMPCNDPWHVEQVCAIGRADQPAADKPAPVMTAVLLSQAEIDALGTYDHSLPTGTRIGKRWKKSDGKGGWKMGEYVEDADPKMVGIRWTTIHVKGQTADQPAGDDAAVEDGSHNDIGFLRRSLADMHAHADALKSGWDACDEQRKEAMASLERALAEVAGLRAKLAATKTCYEAEIEKQQEGSAHWKQEYDGAMAANGRLATERDKALERVAFLEAGGKP